MAFKGYDMYVKIGVDRKDMDKDLDKVEKDLKKSKLLKNKLLTKLGVDPKEFDEKMEKAHKKVEKLTAAVKKVGTTMGTALGKVGSLALNATTTALKATTAALGGAVAGVVALAKQSYSAYAEYQQLVGGVQKLYGNMNMSLEDWAAQQHKTVEEARADYERNAEAEKYIMDKAKNAFATTGMSANKYMETATQFSANLVASYGGDTLKAAEETDKAMRQISDNWNTFGGDIAEIEHAYKGFAKQNYTMLDNLRLPYGGTKAEMERLIADAEKLDSTFKASRLENGDYAMSFNDIIDAIGIVQDDLQISGTTARESASTIAGSFGSLKAAWENLVTGFADPKADLGKLINNVVTTASTALKNAVPTIVQALSGIGQAIEQLAPVIGEQLPSLIEQTLPAILSAASSLVQSIADSLPSLVGVIKDQLPSALETILPVAISGLMTIFQAIGDLLPELLKIIEDNSDLIMSGILSIMETVGGIILQAFPILASAIEKGLPQLLKNIQSNLGSIKSALTSILKTIGTLLVKLAPVIIPMVMKIGLDLLVSLTKGITENADQFVAGVMTIIQTLIDVFLNPDTMLTVLECGLQIILAIVQGISNNIDTVLQAVWKVIESIVQFIILSIPDLIEFLGKSGAEIVTKVLPALLTNVGQAGADLLEMIIGMIGGWLITITSEARDTFEGIGLGIMHAGAFIWTKVTELAEDVINWIKTGLLTIFDVGANLVYGLWDGICSVGDWLKNKITGFGSGITGWLEDTLGIHSPSKVTAWMGKMLDEGLVVGVEDSANNTFRDIENAFNRGMDNLDIHSIDVDAVGNIGVKSKVSGTYEEVQNSRINDLIELVRGLMNQEQEIVIPVYVAGRQVDEILVNGKNRITTRSGGQVNV